MDYMKIVLSLVCCVFFQAEDGMRDLVRSRGLGDVYKRQVYEKSLSNLIELINSKNALKINESKTINENIESLSLIHI